MEVSLYIRLRVAPAWCGQHGRTPGGGRDPCCEVLLEWHAVTSMPKVLVLLLVVQTSKAMAMHSRVQPPRLSQWGWARVMGVGVGVGARIHGGGPMPLAHWVSQLTSKGYF